jgi:hypothetical protein
MAERCRAIRGFSGFPAGSLPSLRLLPIVVAKPLILPDFSARGEPRKIFTLSFPVRQGKGEAALPCAPTLWRRPGTHRLRDFASRLAKFPGFGHSDIVSVSRGGSDAPSNRSASRSNSAAVLNRASQMDGLLVLSANSRYQVAIWRNRLGSRGLPSLMPIVVIRSPH